MNDINHYGEDKYEKFLSPRYFTIRALKSRAVSPLHSPLHNRKVLTGAQGRRASFHERPLRVIKYDKQGHATDDTEKRKPEKEQSKDPRRNFLRSGK